MNTDTKQTGEKVCPQCNESELDKARIKDADAGGVLITVRIVYCPYCMYLENYSVEISK